MTDGLPQRQAFIGVGTMGSLLASCLLDAGVELTVHDRRRVAAASLLARGARWAGSPAAATADCGIVWVLLPGPAEVESVLLGRSAAALNAMLSGATLIDTTTNAPDVARRVAAACHERGIAMLDAPVSGRPPTMTLMAGGDRAAFDAARPALDTIAAQVFYVGEAGAGCTAKLATQYMGCTNLIAAIEGMLIGKMGGVDPAVLAEIVPASSAASRAFNSIPDAILNRSFTAGGALDLVAKDVDLDCELAERLGAPANAGGVANLIYKAAQDAGLGSAGYPAVARVLDLWRGQNCGTGKVGIKSELTT